MRNEFSANNSLAIEVEIKALQKKIREHVGFVPSDWYDRLDQLEMMRNK